MVGLGASTAGSEEMNQSLGGLGKRTTHDERRGAERQVRPSAGGKRVYFARC
jgi:hypothetical protein